MSLEEPASQFAVYTVALPLEGGEQADAEALAILIKQLLFDQGPLHGGVVDTSLMQREDLERHLRKLHLKREGVIS